MGDQAISKLEISSSLFRKKVPLGGRARVYRRLLYSRKRESYIALSYHTLPTGTCTVVFFENFMEVGSLPGNLRELPRALYVPVVL
jgi:hypothetical protein